MNSRVIHRVILGGIVTKPLGVQTPFRNPMCAFPFVKTAFERNTPQGLDITITLESEERSGGVQGNIEIVSGTRQMLENALAALPPSLANAQSLDKTSSEPLAQGSFVQICLGSKEFFQVFIRYWAAFVGTSASRWEPDLLQALKESKIDDVLWIDMMQPGKIFRDNARDMMTRNIGSMIM